MARREKKSSAVKRAGAAIARTAKKLTKKLRPGRRRTVKTEEPVAARATTRSAPKVKTARAVSRPTKRQTDIPMDVIAQTYAPKTSVKSGFRASDADLQRDQDVPGKRAWNDEDHYSNRSGDPRIGTHGRAYEPGEKK